MKFELDAFNRNATDEELLQDLIAAKARLEAQGKGLTFRAYKEVGKFSAATINERFGSWNQGLSKAGISPTEEKNVSAEALFENIKLVWISKGRQPVYRDMGVPPSKYTGSTSPRARMVVAPIDLVSEVQGHT